MIIPNDKKEEQTCMICEQGDLGLFADPISSEEQKSYNESVERENSKEEH
jgi:hypothetical protein